MFRNYLTISLRSLRRHRVVSLVNLLGLGLGIACCLLAVAFIRYELSWNNTHPNADRIVRILFANPSENRVVPRAGGGLSPALKEVFPEVEGYARSMPRLVWVRAGATTHRERLEIADPSILDVFNLPILEGDRETIFQAPHSLLVTATTSKRWFGDESPIGKTVFIESKISGGDYTITGLIEDFPPNSTYHFRFVTNSWVGSESAKTPGVTAQGSRPWTVNATWGGPQSFLLLRSADDIASLAEKLPAFVRELMGEEWASREAYRLQPLNDVHLYGRTYGLPRSESDIELLYLIGGIALLILLVACANFVNLSTANASRRQREIGIRKAAGAHRRDLFGQFILETLMTSLTAMVIGIGFAMAFLPMFRSHSGQALPEGMALLEGVLPFVPLVWIGVALLAGLYPAAVLSSFEPVQALKSSSQPQSGRGLFRKGLILGQFVTCILLIVCTIVMHQQTAYLKNKPLGFDKELVVTMPIFVLDQASKPNAEDHLAHRYATVKAAFENHPGVVGISAYRWTPGVLGGIRRSVRADGETLQMRMLEVDEDYIDLFDIPLVAGRNFNPGSLHAEEGEFLINESAAKALGWEDPVGKSFDWNDWGPTRHGRVVGVVKDFHQQKLSASIDPVAIYFKSAQLHSIAVKIKPEHMDETFAFLAEVWERFLPGRPLEYRFLDERIDEMYRQEERTTQVMTDFSVLAIFLGCMGLFGLVWFTVEYRRKEIGIRKTLGAGVWDIVHRLSREFGSIVIAANLVAWPVGFYLLREWLNRFAYRIEPEAWHFVMAGAAALVVAMGTVGVQAVRAARANPVDVLRDE